MVFSPDGRTLFSASKDKTVRIWDIASGESIRVLRLPIGPGRLGTLYGLDIAPDGKLLAVGGVGPTRHDAWIYLVSLPVGQIVPATFRGHAETVIAVRFFPDGKRLASCGEDKTAGIWNVETGHCDQVLTGHTRQVYDLAISPDGQRIVTASFDGTARIWSTESGVMELELRDAFEGKYYWMRSAAWSPDGKTIATGSSDGIIRFWTADGDLRSKVGPLGGEIQSLDFDRGSRSSCLPIPWATATRRVGSRIEPRVGAFQRSSARPVSRKTKPGWKLAATAGYHGEELFLWNAANGELVHHSAAVAARRRRQAGRLMARRSRGEIRAKIVTIIPSFRSNARFA